MDQSPAQPTELSQIGVNLVAPSGTGDIKNYTVIYVTNNRALARRFQMAGLPAIFDPQLTYECTGDSSGLSGELYVSAAGEELPSYFLFGTETEALLTGAAAVPHRLGVSLAALTQHDASVEVRFSVPHCPHT